MNTQIDFETRIAIIRASDRALWRARDGLSCVVNTLRSDFSKIEHYKDIDDCANAFDRVERALMEAFDIVNEAGIPF